MQSICEKTKLIYDPCLLTPTLAGNDWGGSSHQGIQSKINPQLAEYFIDVLSTEEISKIEKACSPLINFLNESKSTPLDLTMINKKYLYDYDYQKRYFHDEVKTAMYSLLVNCRRRRVLIKPPGLISVFAYFYSKLIKIIHIPRLIKQKYLPGVGKQNYT